ncbi:hypothetical protein M885DRAFT_460395 [Pelagophyceae sp. CCMP2097]|nr:hypothetical protein M885DRAFT_460395 [Pelagophyceae sp. CCMP2097]
MKTDPGAAEADDAAAAHAAAAPHKAGRSWARRCRDARRRLFASTCDKEAAQSAEVDRMRQEIAALQLLARRRGATSVEVREAAHCGDVDEAKAVEIATEMAFLEAFGDVARPPPRDFACETSASAALPLVIVTNAGETVADELVLVLLRCLAERGLVQPQAVVANGAPARDRARLVRGTLDLLGFFGVAVGSGTDGGPHVGVEARQNANAPWDDACADAYVPRAHTQAAKSLISGRRLLHLSFVRARPKSLSLLLVSSLKDAALFLRDNTDLFCAKILHVTISGDVVQGGGPLEPDLSSPNNATDAESAKYLFRRLRELGVPVTAVGRAASRAVRTPRAVFDKLACMGSPVGWRLRAAQKEQIEALWAACVATDDRAAQRLNAVSHHHGHHHDAHDDKADGDAFEAAAALACVALGGPGSTSPKASSEKSARARFLREYCGGKILPPGDGIWDHVEGFAVDKVLSLVAAVPSLAKRFLDFEIVKVDGVEQRCVRGEENVREAPALAALLAEAYSHGISLNAAVARPALVLISDVGQDPDDEMALILLRSLVEEGLVDCEGVVCNLQPASRRALLARGTLDVLGLGAVPVAVGSDGGSKEHADSFSLSARHYMPEELSAQLDGQALLRDLYDKAPLGGLHLLCISSLTDAADFVRSHPELFAAKTKSVTIMGGVLPFDATDGAPLLPDSAHNNTFDFASAEYVYATVQALRIPLVVLSRHAAYTCPVPRRIYDDLAWTGHPVGLRLQQTQRDCIEGLWKRAASADLARRAGLPARCDKAWFVQTFCSSAPEGLERSQDDAVWDLITSFNMYDPLALIACVPELRHKFFACQTKRVQGVDHVIIGMSEEETGVKPGMVEPLRDFIYRGLFKGCTLNFSNYAQLAEQMPRHLLEISREGPDLSDGNETRCPLES